MNKNYYLFVFLILAKSAVYSQTHTTNFRTTEKNIKVEENVEDRYIWLFDEFKKSVIYVENEYSKYMMNYKLTTDVFVAKDESGNSKMLSEDLKIDSMIIEDRVFIFHPQFRYLERLGSFSNTYYIKYRTTYVLEEIKQGGYGDALASASVQSINILAGQGEGIPTRGNFLHLSNTSGNPVRVHLTTGPLLGVIIGGNFKTIQRRRDLIRLYPENKSSIKLFLRENKVKFDVREDIITLIDFLSTLP